MKDLWLFKEAREHIHWWDSVSPHMLVNIFPSIIISQEPCLSSAARWLTCWKQNVRCFMADVLEACLVMRVYGQDTEDQASCAEHGI